MKVVLSVNSGWRVKSLQYYAKNSYWYPNYIADLKKNPKTHEQLAQILEKKHSPMAKFEDYLNGDRKFYAKGTGTVQLFKFGAKTRFTSAWLDAFKESSTADSFKTNLQNRLVNMWREWLSYNLGHFAHTKAMEPNPNYQGLKKPLIDTKQYMMSIFFSVKYVGRDRQQMNLIYKYYSSAKSRQELVREWVTDPDGITAELDFDTVKALGF